MARLTIFNGPIPAAGTSTSIPVTQIGDLQALTIEGEFVYGSGGTTAKAYIQTSLDGGTTWVDIANLAFALATIKKISKVLRVNTLAAAYVPTDGTLTDDTVKDGLLGDQLQVKLIVVGTYAASSLAIYAETG
jgi:hypothetical protein